MKILFVAMAESVHTYRWINQLLDEGWDLHLFPSIDSGYVYNELNNMDITIHQSAILPYKSSNNFLLKAIYFSIRMVFYCKKVILTKIFPNYRIFLLRNLIKKIEPDVIHSMEFQSAGYLLLNVKRQYKGTFPFWIATNWGSDIYYFRQFPEHKEKIIQILEECDYYSCECDRDIRIAKEMGLKGKVLPLFPNTGGFDLKKVLQFRQSGLSSERNIVLLKGYQGWAGRALVGLQALELCGKVLEKYKIIIYSASSEVKDAARKLEKAQGITIECIPQISHEELLNYFGHARLYIGLSNSDAISISLLEAIVMGTFPIQSNTSCADEWIMHGRNGFIVPPENPIIIAEAIIKALFDDKLINTAAEINNQIAISRLDHRIIKPKVIEMYEQIAADNNNDNVKI